MKGPRILSAAPTFRSRVNAEVSSEQALASYFFMLATKSSWAFFISAGVRSRMC